MSYFKRFPVIKGYDIIGRTFNMMDITRRTGFLGNVQNDETTYIPYTIEDGETPIHLADRLYDDVDLYWVILMFNNMMDITTDWPLDNNSLNTYINRVYIDPNAVHHYESIATNAVVDNNIHPSYDTIPITNYEYEVSVNDAKRDIKVPIPEVVDQIVREHNRLIQQ